MLTQSAEAVDLPRALITTFSGLRAIAADMLASAIPASAPVQGCGRFTLAFAFVCPLSFALTLAVSLTLAFVSFL